MPSQLLPGTPSSSLRLLPRFAAVSAANSLRGTGAGEKENSSVKKGLLWHQKDRLFSRWKERYFVLTRDYLICFQRATKGIASSEMGTFIFKVSLAEVDSIERVDRKGSAAIAVSVPREGRLFLRSKTGLDEWLKALRETVNESKGRREALRHTLTRDYHSQMLDGAHHFRLKMPVHHTLSDSQQESARVNRALMDELNSGFLRTTNEHQATPHLTKKANRLSLMTDVDLNYEFETPPSTPSVQWSSSRTPLSTPRGSLCHSRPASRMADDSYATTPELSNGHSCHSEPMHRRERHLAVVPTNDQQSRAPSEQYSSGYSNGYHRESPSSRQGSAASFKGSRPRAEHHQRNMSGDLTSCNRHPPHCNGQAGQEEQPHRSRNRRFSLANATELLQDVLWHNNNNNGTKYSPPNGTNNGYINGHTNGHSPNGHRGNQMSNGTPQWQTKVAKPNGLILRAASERHPVGRQPPDILYRERSGNDLRRLDSPPHKRWGSEKDMFLNEAINGLHQHQPQQQQLLNIYTHL